MVVKIIDSEIKWNLVIENWLALIFLDNGLVLNRQQAIIQNYNDPLVYRVQWKDNQHTICCFYAYWREK